MKRTPPESFHAALLVAALSVLAGCTIQPPDPDPTPADSGPSTDGALDVAPEPEADAAPDSDAAPEPEPDAAPDSDAAPEPEPDASPDLCPDGACPDCEEVCDGVDNDCDGQTDEGPDGGDLVEPCYEGPAGTADVGACTGGERRCADGAFGACEGQILPADERCDGSDNDCNGAVDDAETVGEPCAAGIGACAAEGQRVCDVEAGAVVCDAIPAAPGDEICDGQDNDCDGEIDDVPGVGAPCAVGVGACEADGVRVCGDDGALVCDARPGEPADEACNGIDDDCDGVLDEVAGIGERCEVGRGICRSVGQQLCGRDGLVCGAVEQDPERAEFCDNALDDDCDGETDEDDCIVPCDADADCGFRQLCEDGACVPGDCRGDDDCNGLCIDAFCRPGDCRDDAECADGELCDAYTCTVPPAACADAPAIRGFGTVEGTTEGAPSEAGASCAGGAGSPERIYRLQLPHQGTVCLDTFGSDYDTALYVRADCARRDSELGCNDDRETGFLQSQLEVDVGERPVFVFVDGFSNRAAGAFRLTVRPGPCAVCEADDQCSTYASCRQPPAALPRVPFEVDARVECGRDAGGATVPIDGLEPWPAYAAFYTGGAGIYDVDDGRQWFGVSVAVDGITKASAPSVPGLTDLPSVEAAFAGRSTSAFTMTEGAQVEAFFLDNFCGDNAGTVRAEMRPVAACTDACDFDAECRAGVCLEGRCQRARDFDFDGVPDHVDLDDDNDGIPDAVECFGTGPIAVRNGSFELPAPPNGEANFSIGIDQVPDWSAPRSHRFMEIWTDRFVDVRPGEGQQVIELNSDRQGQIFQDLRPPAGTRYDIRFVHRGRDGVEAMALRIGPPAAPREVMRVETGQEWVEYRATYIVPDGQPVTRFEFFSLVEGSMGNLLDGVSIVPRCDGGADADGDGRPNHLDTDADGDDRSDAVEAGHGVAQGGRVAGPYGANGLADVLETRPDSGDLGYDIPGALPAFLDPGR